MKIIDATTKVYNKSKILFFSIVAVGIAGAVAIPYFGIKRMPEVETVDLIDESVQEEVEPENSIQDVREFDIDTIVNAMKTDENGNMVYEEITYDINDQKSIDNAYAAEMKRMEQDPLYFNPNGLPKVESVYEYNQNLVNSFENMIKRRKVDNPDISKNSPGNGTITIGINKDKISLYEPDAEKLKECNQKTFESVSEHLGYKVNEKWIENKVRKELTDVRKLVTKYAETSTGVEKDAIDLVLACAKDTNNNVTFNGIKLAPESYCGAVAKWAFDGGNYDLNLKDLNQNTIERSASEHCDVIKDGIYTLNLDNIDIGYCFFNPNFSDSYDFDVSCNIDNDFCEFGVGFGFCEKTNEKFEITTFYDSSTPDAVYIGD